MCECERGYAPSQHSTCVYVSDGLSTHTGTWPGKGQERKEKRILSRLLLNRASPFVFFCSYTERRVAYVPVARLCNGGGLHWSKGRSCSWWLLLTRVDLTAIIYGLVPRVSSMTSPKKRIKRQRAFADASLHGAEGHRKCKSVAHFSLLSTQAGTSKCITS